MSYKKLVQKYLLKQNSDKWKISLFPHNKYSNIVVIPAISESKGTKTLIASLFKTNLKNVKKTLILFVINNKKSHSPEIKEDNLVTVEYLKKIMAENKSKLDIGYIDCFSEGNELPEKDGGVGFARKIGMDLSLNYFDESSSDPKIIICLDADCKVSENYIFEIAEKFKKQKMEAAVINFEHQQPDNFEQYLAIINYEIFLKYYVLGLQYSNSIYAFHSIGSAIAVGAETYIKIGGMNKRAAGEDFYFLQKLAKMVKIHKVVGATVFPSSRISLRTPYGTGTRISRFLENSISEYEVYSPKSFEILKKWLNLFSETVFSHSREKSAIETQIIKFLEKTKNIEISLYNFLIEQNFTESWTKILRNSKTSDQINKQKNIWMDGFRTMKLIHYLRDNSFPNENMFASVNYILQKNKVEPIPIPNELVPNFETQLKFLEQLRLLQSKDA